MFFLIKLFSFFSKDWISLFKNKKELYKLNRLLFELKVASSLLEQVMDTMVVGPEFTTAYLDDTLLQSENNEQHKNIRAVFQKINKYGFKLG